MRRVLTTYLPWGLIFVLLAVGLWFYVERFEPLDGKLAAAEENLWAAGLDAKECEQKLATRADLRSEMEERLERLESRNKELEQAQEELEDEIMQKQAELDKLANIKKDLKEQLKEELHRGEVLIKQISGNLVVDVSDRVLFDSGEAELNEKGKQVLARVGESLRKVKDKIIQVGGHTDSLPISKNLEDRFPSNWELSSARATVVVRFLQDQARIPGDHLMATGFAQYRPVASNASSAGRRLNRRIEIVLLPEITAEGQAKKTKKSTRR